jgi:hypothetical protein
MFSLGSFDIKNTLKKISEIQMPDSQKPGEKPLKNRQTPMVKAFQQSDYDIIYPEGELIDVDPDTQSGYIVRQGSVAVEMIIPAPGGLLTIGLDTVEAGEYFNIHSLFGFKLEDGSNLRYRTQCRTIIMPVTEDMLPQNPQKLSLILRSFMQTAARREGKLRQLTGYALQRAEEKRADRTGGSSQLLNKYRQELEKRGKRIAELEKAISDSRTAIQQTPERGVRITEIENANAVLRRDKLKLSQNLKTLDEELTKTRGKLALEERTRKALERRNAELTQQLASSESAVSSAKFPSANFLLESHELGDLEKSAKHFRDAAAHFENLATMMQRAMELIAEDNPGMVISEDVMMLMTGQEPTPRPSVKKARAYRDSKDFKTIHLGSESPESALAKADHDNEWVDTSAQTPYAKQKPEVYRGGGLPKHKQTDRNQVGLTAQNTANGIDDENSPNSGQIHSEGSLSQMDVNAILEEFVEHEPRSSESLVYDVPPSSGINAPYPGGASWDEPDTGNRQTRPFIPDGDHFATNSEIDIPPHPPAPRLDEPPQAKTPNNNARGSTKISGRHLHPSTGSGFPPHEVDSDITPVVPEFPPNEQKDSPKSVGKPPPSWKGNTFFGRSEGSDTYDPQEIPTRQEESGSTHSAVNFTDENTEVRQIQEDWRNRSQQPIHPIQPKKPAIISSANDASSPPEILIELEAEEANLTMSDAEWIDSDSVRTTKAYAFRAPGKPPKPKT